MKVGFDIGAGRRVLENRGENWVRMGLEGVS